MKPDFVSFLQCPARDCQATNLTLDAKHTDTIHYKDGPAEEVREGSLNCPTCRRSYPISDYVPSFEQLYPEELQQEAEYWGKWYGFMWQRGYLAYFDLRAPMAPLITEGIEVLDPSTLDHQDLGGSHSLIADHPSITNAEWLLDIGCGTGWSSLYFARRGHNVVGFDPAVANMRLAKRYAISQGEYVEYMGAAMGFLHFKPSVFDGAVALHSIHHVPNLRDEMTILRTWLKDGAGMGIDEHVRNDEVLMAIIAAARKWANEEVYPRVRTLSPDVLEGLPRAEPSAMEGAGSEDVIGAFLDNFEVESFRQPLYHARPLQLHLLPLAPPRQGGLRLRGQRYPTYLPLPHGSLSRRCRVRHPHRPQEQRRRRTRQQPACRASTPSCPGPDQHRPTPATGRSTGACRGQESPRRTGPRHSHQKPAHRTTGALGA